MLEGGERIRAMACYNADWSVYIRRGLPLWFGIATT